MTMAEQKPGMADHGPGAAHEAGHSHGAAHGTAYGAASHPHGTMDTTAQEKTFAAFIRMAMRAAVVIVGVLIFMALANA